MAGSSGQPTQSWLAWQAFKSSVGTPVRTNASTSLGMGYMELPNAQNNEIVWPIYLDSVTYKIASIGTEGTNLAIATFLFDGVSLGTIDWYAGTGAGNTYKESTGASIATPKAADLTMRAATKNASSSGYLLHTNSVAIIKTSGTSSTPAGTDTPGYTHEHIWFAGVKTDFTGSSLVQNSARFGGGGRFSNGSQNSEAGYDVWLEARTYKYGLVHWRDTDRGIYTVLLDAVSQTTIDGYAAVADSTYSEATALAVASAGVKAHTVKMATKNASSTNYYGLPITSKWISTGA